MKKVLMLMICALFVSNTTNAQRIDVKEDSVRVVSTTNNIDKTNCEYVSITGKRYTIYMHKCGRCFIYKKLPSGKYRRVYLTLSYHYTMCEALGREYTHK